MKYHALALGGLLAVSAPTLHAGCCAHHDSQESHDAAQAIGDYRIIAREEIADPSGHIFTRYTAELNDALKGKAPGRLEFRTPGGRHGDVMEYSSLGQDLAKGDDYILHLKRNAAGKLAPEPFQTHANRGTLAEKKAVRSYFRSGARGKMPVVKQPPAPGGKDEGFSGVPGSVVTPTGYSHVTVNNIAYPSRFTVCDGAIPIPYLVDIDPATLPPGMTSQGALDAVTEALAAWSSASCLKFRFAGTQTFGQSADKFTERDGFIRIQLHDNHNYINTVNVAGIGGGRMTADPDFRPGGSIAGQAFHERFNGFVVLEHDLAFMDNIANFKQVLTHELGHALGLAHSSDNPSEPEPILKNATMYWKASNDGRGTALTIYDEDRIAYGYPKTNTPPYLPDRFINALADGSSSSDLPVGTNRIELRAVNLQAQSFTSASMLFATDPARWTLSGNQLAYKPADFVNATRKTDAEIAAGNFLSFAYAQVSDGTNLSRVARIGVIQITSDSKPADAMPNTWMQNNFNNTNPGAVGTPSHPDSDPDGDRLSNRTEYLIGTDPKSPASPSPNLLTYDRGQGKVTLSPMRYITYAIQSSTNLQDWTTRAQYNTISEPADMSFDVSQDASAERIYYRAIPLP